MDELATRIKSIEARIAQLKTQIKPQSIDLQSVRDKLVESLNESLENAFIDGKERAIKAATAAIDQSLNILAVTTFSEKTLVKPGKQPFAYSRAHGEDGLTTKQRIILNVMAPGQEYSKKEILERIGLPNSIVSGTLSSMEGNGLLIKRKAILEDYKVHVFSKQGHPSKNLWKKA